MAQRFRPGTDTAITASKQGRLSAIEEIDEVAEATRRCAAIGVAFVKSSTGFGPGGASIEAVQTILDAANGTTKVKASGGIRTYVDAQKFIDLGCHRLGVGFSTTPVLCGDRPAEATNSSY